MKDGDSKHGAFNPNNLEAVVSHSCRNACLVLDSLQGFRTAVMVAEMFHCVHAAMAMMCSRRALLNVQVHCFMPNVIKRDLRRADQVCGLSHAAAYHLGRTAAYTTQVMHYDVG